MAAAINSVERNRVVVTGLGAVSALGVGIEQLWTGWATGRSGIRRAAPAIHRLGVHVTAAITDSVGELVASDPRIRRALNRGAECGVLAAQEALADAGLPHRLVGPERLSIVLGMGPIDSYEVDHLNLVTDDTATEAALGERVAAAIHPLRRLRLLPNTTAAVIAIDHQACGPSTTLVGPLAGAEAIQAAHALILDDLADAVICGGVDARLSEVLASVIAGERRCSRSTSPGNSCRPFDRDRTGIVPGEGAAVLLLERESTARARGCDWYAILDQGLSTHRSMAGQHLRLLVDHSNGAHIIIAHGDGGIDSDDEEAALLGEAVHSIPTSPSITSLQPSIGHTSCAAGAFNAIAACLVLEHGSAPPIQNLKVPIADLPFVTTLQSGDFSVAIANAYECDAGLASLRFVR